MTNWRTNLVFILIILFAAVIRIAEGHQWFPSAFTS